MSQRHACSSSGAPVQTAEMFFHTCARHIRRTSHLISVPPCREKVEDAETDTHCIIGWSDTRAVLCFR